MNRIATLTAADRRVLLGEGAQRLKLLPVVLEKDFWVCWMLGLLFGHPERSGALVFKGGTALSKVYGVIQRFSEDIDLSVSPANLGIAEAEVDESMSRRRRDQWIHNLEAACRQWVAERLQPELEQEITAVIGARAGGRRWLEFETDTVTQSPVLYFHYPGTQEAGVPSIRRAVKLELGSLTDQRPVGRHRVRPWLTEVLPGPWLRWPATWWRLMWDGPSGKRRPSCMRSTTAMLRRRCRGIIRGIMRTWRPWPRATKSGTRCRMSRCWSGW